MTAIGHDTLKTRTSLTSGGKVYSYYDLNVAAAQIGDISRLPFSMKVLLENLLRFEDGVTVNVEDITAFVGWLADKRSDREIQYRPARVLMQDFTGVPAVVDLAAMRNAMTDLGGDPTRINPLVPVDLVIDHSVMVDNFGAADSFKKNVELEFQRNMERYEFLKWGQQAMKNFRVVPPGTGICHQVNLEYLAQVAWTSEDASGATVVYPDTLVGTDSHTTMVNGLGVLGWGVGGIEAEAAMLGQPVSMLIPEVVGFKLTGAMREGMTATDLVLTVTNMLRKKGVVGKFVEFYGPGLLNLTLADMATIANMAPEYGATCGFFPVCQVTLDYLRFTGRDEARVQLVEAYARAQGMWADATTPDPVFTDTLGLDLGTVEPSLAGPRRPQDRVALSVAAPAYAGELMEFYKKGGDFGVRYPVAKADGSPEAFDLGHGDVVIAAITSCTNTSNPSVLVAAGLVAKKARALGLARKPWVKSSLAPGSQVVTDYLNKADLTQHLDALGFNLVGYGCTTCIGNSGPLPEAISKVINEKDLVACSVISGNRNFEGRVSPDVKANYLASPPLVVAYALAGSMKINITSDPIGMGSNGQPVYLRDIWPTNREIEAAIAQCITSDMFKARYANVFKGDDYWQKVKTSSGMTYDWNPSSTYVKHPPYFQGMSMAPTATVDIKGARLLAVLGDSITTDHISPAGNIKAKSPAGAFLMDRQVPASDFNSYGARRGNDDVMVRGTFANIRIRNDMTPGVEGGVTTSPNTGEVVPIYDAAQEFAVSHTPLMIIAGKEYGTGSSRDWAAKGTNLLGVKAVLAESFERIHRSNLVGMAVLPLQFKDGMTRAALKLNGTESFDIPGMTSLKPLQDMEITMTRTDGSAEKFTVMSRIDTANEVEYFYNGGVLPYVLRKLAA
jgi:aconitate hydratase